MKKTTLVIIGSLLLIFGASMVMRRSYELDLIHGVVLNMLIQKRPEDYPSRKVRQTFQTVRAAMEREDRKQAYLKELFSLSQRLEKVQKLSRDEMDEILDSLIGENNRTIEQKSNREALTRAEKHASRARETPRIEESN